MRGLPTINLADLPLPPVLQPIDYEDLLSDIVAEFKARWSVARATDPTLPMYDVEMLETDPAKIVLESAAYIYMLTLQRVNDAAKALMLATTTGGDLDQFAQDFALTRLAGESDEAFRQRRWLATEGYAAGGPEDAYRFFALAADPSIKQAVAVKGADNRVDLVLLSRLGNGAAAPEIVTKVHEALSPTKTRPLTDSLYIRSATIIETPVQATITVPFGPDRAVVRAKAIAGMTAYAARRHAVGRVLRINGLEAAAQENNAIEAITITSPPADIDPGAFGAVYATSVDVTIAD